MSTRMRSEDETNKTKKNSEGYENDLWVQSITLHQSTSGAYLGLDVLCGEALGDDVDALGVRQDVGPPLGVVHQGLDAANQGGVDLGLGGLVVHALQEVQDAGQTVQVNEPCHKPGRGEQVRGYVCVAGCVCGGGGVGGGVCGGGGGGEDEGGRHGVSSETW